ncbi:solute carrier family 66, member 2 [Entomortierella parvispora]|uniref:Solute carrier family 66, member 2 n=1 Tax=Entomortierella parvispora TaxID=205924 RepID=A0A9P3LW19_9FUNG|nr:solute carrier family 66, member 2 [Entomortierella parvispora]
MLDPVDPTEPMPWDLIRMAMVVGPVTGYFHQYYTMYRMKTSMGFSSVTCGVLIVSSIIRIFFWVGEPFDDALLYQSILMTIVQLFLLELCVRYYPWTVQIPAPVTHSIPASRLFNVFRNQQSQYQQLNHGINGALFSSVGSGSASSPTSSTLPSVPAQDHVTTRASRVHGSGVGWYREHAAYWGTHFWNWPTIGPYYLFLAGFTLLVGLSLLVIGNTPFYVGLLGLAALGIEATVPLPQAIQNFRTKSTAGFSPAILLMWVIGDSFKTYYYIANHLKYQFIACGIIQLCIDCVIIGQTIVYSKYWKDARRGRHQRQRSGYGGADDSGAAAPLQDQRHLTVGHAGAGQGRSSSEALLSGHGYEDDDVDEGEV